MHFKIRKRLFKINIPAWLKISCLAVLSAWYAWGSAQAEPVLPAQLEDKELKVENPKQATSRTRQIARANHPEQLRVIEQFIDMPPEKIATIRKMLEHIEKMTPEQRQAFKKRIQQLRNMPAEKRKKLFKEFRSIPVEQRMVMRRYFKSLPPDEGRKARRKFKSMQPEERRQYIEEIMKKSAELPPPDLGKVRRHKRADNHAPDRPPPPRPLLEEEYPTLDQTPESQE